VRFKAQVLSAGKTATGVEVPADLAKELKREPAAKRAFEDLSYGRTRWYVEGIEGAKKPETRQRRVEKAIEDLKEGAT
jgi:uncharacterized protein YdeI (YjbR/CyaY-like superfamily)